MVWQPAGRPTGSPAPTATIRPRSKTTWPRSIDAAPGTTVSIRAFTMAMGVSCGGAAGISLCASAVVETSSGSRVAKRFIAIPPA